MSTAKTPIQLVRVNQLKHWCVFAMNCEPLSTEPFTLALLVAEAFGNVSGRIHESESTALRDMCGKLLIPGNIAH